MVHLKEILGWLHFVCAGECITLVVFVMEERVEKAVFVDGGAHANTTAVSMRWRFTGVPFFQNVGCVCGDLAR